MKNLLQTPLNPLSLNLVQRLSSFRERWITTADVAKDYYASLKQTTIITSAGASTRIEGAILSDDEILNRLEGLNIRHIRDRDEAEVAGYIDSKRYIFDSFMKLPISEHTIRSLHQMMIAYLPSAILPFNQRGAYKNITNSVVRIDHDRGTEDIIFETTPPGPQTDSAMRELIEDYTAFISDPNYSELQVIAAFIVKFLAIHPFRDGNGRMSRLLTDLCLLKCRYDFCQYSSHEKVIEDNKDQYYIALRQTQATLKTTPDMNPWFLFFLKVLDRQTQYLEKELSPKEPGTLTILEEQIFNLIRTHQPVTIGFLERKSGMKRVTLKSILARLKARKTIEMDGSRKGSEYRLA